MSGTRPSADVRYMADIEQAMKLSECAIPLYSALDMLANIVHHMRCAPSAAQLGPHGNKRDARCTSTCAMHAYLFTLEADLASDVVHVAAASIPCALQADSAAK